MTEKIELAIPTPNLNGTDKLTLRRGYYAALAEVQEAIEALCQTWPHGRDYQTQPNPTQATHRAMVQHEERVRKLREVANELQQILIGIDAHPYGYRG